MPYVVYDAVNQSQAFQLGGHRGDVHIHEVSVRSVIINSIE